MTPLVKRYLIRSLAMAALQFSGLGYAQAPERIAPQTAPALSAPVTTATTPVISTPAAAPQAAPAITPAPATVAPAAPAAAPADKLDAGNTAWMLTSTALVLLMTLPGVCLFYGGLVRKKNVLSMCSQVFVIAVIVTITWTLIGYSLAFRPGNGFIGGLDRLFMDGLLVDNLSGNAGANIPESVFAMFQLTFAIITAALIPGAFAERVKFSVLCWFVVLWSVLVYAPVAHWVWEPGGWLAKKGALDYAGGTVVHVNAGIAGLVAAALLGQRKGYGREPMSPHNLVFTIVGASLLWVGWFGFNAGSAVAADGHAGMAMLVTQIATAVAAFSWMGIEALVRGKPSALGLASGAVAGLVAITPASGYVTPVGAIFIGVAAGIGCYIGATTLKRLLGYDDSLDVFGIHGVGGAIGAVLTGIFGVSDVGAIGGQIITQIIAVGATAIYSAAMTLLILIVISFFTVLRVPPEAESEGLDRSEHGEHID